MQDIAKDTLEIAREGLKRRNRLSGGLVDESGYLGELFARHDTALDGVRKERLVFLLLYNLIRALMLRAARRQRVNVNRLSFADALAWLRFADAGPGGAAGAAGAAADTGQAPPTLKVNPLREGRLEPRVLKRQKKEFPYMTAPRATLKAQLRATYCDMS